MATSKDVAKLAGVSHTTVSRAFKKNSSIKPETHARIMDAARQLNYTPDTIAASLRGRHTKTVGMIISHAHVTLFIAMVQAVEAELTKHGYRVLISFDESDPERQADAIRMMAGNRVDGILYMPVPQPHPAKLLAWMQKTNIHFIQFVHRAYDELCSYVFDDVAAALSGMRHLFEHDHRRILMLGGENRVEGYVTAYQELGMQPPIPHESLEGLSADACRKKIRQLIEQHRPTAIFSISDQINIIAYGVLMEMRLRVPEDISLLIFDDAFWSASLGISAIAHPTDAMAKGIVRQILEHASCDGPNQQVTSAVYVPYLVERNTVATLSKPKNETK